MNPNLYIQRKESDLARIELVDDVFYVFYKNFDPDTGEELEETKESLDIEELRAQKVDSQMYIDNINTMLAEMETIQ